MRRVGGRAAGVPLLAGRRGGLGGRSGSRGVPRGGRRKAGPGRLSPELSSLLFSPGRTRNLLRIGVIKKPLWFDVYAAFPPLREPVYRVPRPRYGKVKDVIRPILYQEDEVRA